MINPDLVFWHRSPQPDVHFTESELVAAIARQTEFEKQQEAERQKRAAAASADLLRLSTQAVHRSVTTLMLRGRKKPRRPA